jgi:dipeptidyl aminopeptidase/acylaminoacyl peptidase
MRIAVLISITLMIGAAAAKLHPAEAAFPGGNGRIAYLHAAFPEFWEPQLYVMEPDGTDKTRISNAGYHYDPAWSADGDKLTFAWADNSDSDIWVARADGTDRTQITSGTAYDFHPAWSPNGQLIAFDRYDDPADPEVDVYRVSSMGGTPVNLTNNPGDDTAPSWSPDGSRIAFRSLRIPPGIYVMNADGSNPHLVAPSGSAPDWAPDGARIVYVAVTYEPPAPLAPTGPPPPPEPRDHLWLVNPDGSERHQLTYSPGTESEPSWSPDGTKITYHGRVGMWNEVFVLDLASGTKTQRTQEEGNYSPTWQPLVTPPQPPTPPPPPPPPAVPPVPPPPAPVPPVPPPPPPPPPNHRGPACRVPRVIGMRLSRARRVVRRAHCRVGRIRRARSARPRNVVVAQSPRPGKRFRVGYRAPVKLVVSRGRR